MGTVRGFHELTFGNHCIYHAVFETQNRKQANVAVLHLIFIWNLSGSKLGRDTDYSDFYFS